MQSFKNNTYYYSKVIHSYQLSSSCCYYIAFSQSSFININIVFTIVSVVMIIFDKNVSKIARELFLL